MSYNNWIFNISALIFSILKCRSHFGGNYHAKLSKSVTLFLIQGFQLFDNSIDIVLAFEFGHEITMLRTMLRTAIFDIVDYKLKFTHTITVNFIVPIRKSP